VNKLKNIFLGNPLAIGYLELTIAQCFVGLNVICGKLLITYFPIFLLLASRFAIGFAGMVGMAAMKNLSLRKVYQHFMALSLKDKVLLIFQAACGGFLFNVFILYGMKSTSATAAGIITSITPIMIFILSALFLREKINFQKGLAICIVMLGLMVLNLGKDTRLDSGALLGNFLVFLAVIPEALFTILSKSVGKKISETEAVILVNFFNFLMFLPFAIWDLGSISWHEIQGTQYGQVLIYGISGGILFFLLWYRGLTKISANIAALFTGVMPISTSILAFVFLKEPMQFSDLLGMTLVILAIFIGCNAKVLRLFMRIFLKP